MLTFILIIVDSFCAEFNPTFLYLGTIFLDVCLIEEIRKMKIHKQD